MPHLITDEESLKVKSTLTVYEFTLPSQTSAASDIDLQNLTHSHPEPLINEEVTD